MLSDREKAIRKRHEFIARFMAKLARKKAGRQIPHEQLEGICYTLWDESPEVRHEHEIEWEHKQSGKKP